MTREPAGFNAPPRKGPVAVIDIGTNSVLFLLAERDGTAVRPIRQEIRTTRLGSGLASSGRIGTDAIGRTATVLAEWNELARATGAGTPVCTGTQVFRAAANRQEVLTELLRETGLKIEVLPEQEEAVWSYMGVVHGLPESVSERIPRGLPSTRRHRIDWSREAGPRGKRANIRCLFSTDRRFPAVCGGELQSDRAVVMDIGGGSTEWAAGRGTALIRSRSVPVGALTLTEKHLKSDPPGAAELDAMTDEIRSAFAADIPTQDPSVPFFCVGGTATTLAGLELGLDRYDAAVVDGTELGVRVVRTWAEKLAGQPRSLRRETVRLDPDRADILPAGLFILLTWMESAGIPTVRVSDRGLRFGIAARELGLARPVALPVQNA